MKSLYYGCMPAERDGGAVVFYYQLRKMYELDKTNEYYLIPKVKSQVDKTALPFAKFVFPNKKEYIPQLMEKLGIKTFWSFHIANGLDELVDPIHEVDGKIINWQTIHWTTDMIFTMENIKKIDYWVAPTNYARSVLNQIGKIPSVKISVIPHGVDREKFYPEPHEMNKFRSEHGISPKTKVILFSGRLDTWKGIQNVIPVIRYFTEKYDCVFVIKAHPDENSKISLGLDLIFSTIASRNPKVFYSPKWVKPEEMENIFHSLDILLSPTGHEGFNVPLIESMACGKPVLTTNLTNHREIVGKAGLMFKPTVKVGVCDKVQPIKVLSPQQIKDGLEYLLQNPELCEEMGEIGKERVKKYFDLEKVSMAWLELLKYVEG